MAAYGAALATLHAGDAGAQEPQEMPPPSPAPLQRDEGPTPSAYVLPYVAAQDRRLDERTAYTIGAQRFKIGVLALEYGIVDEVSVGTDPPAWAARAVLPVFIPNLHAKVRVYQQGELAVAARVAGYYAGLSSDELSSGRLISVPLSAFASIPVAPRWLVHPEATYVFARAFGTGDLDDADVNGAVAAQAAILGALIQYRLSRVVSLTALGRYQVYTGRLVFEAEDRIDPYTTADLEATLESRVENPWQAIGGVALIWEYVRLTAGVGYGHYFVPGVEVALPDRGIVPDFSLAVVL